MSELTSQNWFWWAVGLAIGVPLVLFGLGELHAWLVRRGNALAKPVGLLRNYAVPLAALLLLVTRASEISSEESWVKILATVVGFLVILLVLSSLKAAMFVNAEHGTWRQRFPRIFVDIVRVILIAIGLAILFSRVWGTDVGGMFAALGVGSIVIGLALQNAVGSVISGLLLLFEQPFALGDWLQHGDTVGRVVEVNWRAIHIDTGNGLQIVPNAALAGGAFTNLSRPTRAHVEDIDTKFAIDDDPAIVCSVLDTVARDVPHVRSGGDPRTRMVGDGTYKTSLPVTTYADVGASKTAFLTRAWYAARRAGLHLNGGDPASGVSPDDVAAALRQVAPTLHLSEDEITDLAPSLALERFADGEVVLREGEMADSLRFLISGKVEITTMVAGTRVSVGTHERGDFLGQAVLTREPSQVAAVATGVVTTLPLPKAVVDDLMQAKPTLAHEMDEVIESRRQLVKQNGKLR